MSETTDYPEAWGAYYSRENHWIAIASKEDTIRWACDDTDCDAVRLIPESTVQRMIREAVEACRQAMSTEQTINADHARRCEAEGTRDAIFLLQSRLWKMAGKLPGTVSDDQWLKVTDRDEVPDWAVKCIEATDDGDYICNVHQLAMEGVTAGAENALGWPLFEQEWITESVWLDRDEAEAFAKFHVHWFTTGWRVYAVCAEGELAKRLRTFPKVKND